MYKVYKLVSCLQDTCMFCCNCNFCAAKGSIHPNNNKTKYLLSVAFIHTDFAKVLRYPPQKPPLVTMGVSGILLIKALKIISEKIQ